MGEAQLWVDSVRAEYLFQTTVAYLIIVGNSVSCVRDSLPVLAVFKSPLWPVEKFRDPFKNDCDCVGYAYSELKDTLRV